MIVTVTFSPSIDKSSTVPELIPEKKLICTDPKYDPGGGGINVARALKRLGSEAIAVFPSGGYTGKMFNQLMEDEGVKCIIIPSQNETRENFVIVEESTNKQFRFGMPGTPLNEMEWKQCLKAIEEIHQIEFLVASGSPPPGVPVDIYAQLAVISRKKNSKYIVDASGDYLKHALDAGVFLIKPNLGELSALAGGGNLNTQQAKKIALDIIHSGKCSVVIVSMGENGAMLVTHEKTEIYHAPLVEKKSTVGAGDSMVAGLVHYLSQGKDLSEAVRYGVACGTAATLNEGTELCKKEDADLLFTQVGSYYP